MMERLTKKIDNGRFVTTDAEARSYGETDPEDGFFYNYFTGEAVDKLATYEDTGLEPADIEELLAAAPKWISVEERLPEKKVGDEGYVGYLVLSDGEYQIADFTNDKYIQTAYEFHVDGEYDPNVTHWMELPPKEETE